MSKKQKKYSSEFKTGIHLGYCETVRKYKILGKSIGGAINTLRRWERIYLGEGAEGLMKERRDKSNTNGKRGRPPRLYKKVEEDLIAENQRLRMEIEYLKN